MNDMICDDRLDVAALREKICSMTDEEFEEYLKTVKEEEAAAKDPTLGEYDPPLPERLSTLTEQDKAELERLLNKYQPVGADEMPILGEYDPPIRPAVEYYKTLPMEELDRLIAVREKVLEEKRSEQMNLDFLDEGLPVVPGQYEIASDVMARYKKHYQPTIKTIRTEENAKFLRFFERVQQEAAKRDAVFFLDCGLGKVVENDSFECEDLAGWLIPNEKASEFEPFFLESSEVQHDYDDFYIAVDFELSDNDVKVILDDTDYGFGECF